MLHSALRYVLGIPLLAIVGLALNYKYHESEDLRNSIYRPLYAELSQIQNAIQQNHMSVDFSAATKSQLEEKGELNRIPKQLREQVERAYVDAASLIGDTGPPEKIDRITSTQVQQIRTQQQDNEWSRRTVADMNAVLMSKPGSSASRSFEFKHTDVSPGIEAHSENPKYVTPGALTWGFQDWVDYPASLQTIEQLWNDQQFLEFHETGDDWYFRITKEDLARNHLTLGEFLRPIDGAISKDIDFKKIQKRRMDVKAEIDQLRSIIADRIDDPKQLSDLLH